MTEENERIKSFFRWATHGVPSTVNSHPHTSGPENEFIVVHNGIITNYKDVKVFLQVWLDTNISRILCKLNFNINRVKVMNLSLIQTLK